MRITFVLASAALVALIASLPSMAAAGSSRGYSQMAIGAGEYRMPPGNHSRREHGHQTFPVKIPGDYRCLSTHCGRTPPDGTRVGMPPVVPGNVTGPASF